MVRQVVSEDAHDRNAAGDWFPRERLQALVLIAASVLVAYLCYLMAVSFLPALVWGVTFAVIARPVDDRFRRWTGRPAVAAAATTALVTLVIVVPSLFVARELVREAAVGADSLRGGLEGGAWGATLGRVPGVGPTLVEIDGRLDLRAQLQDLAGRLTQTVTGLVGGTAWGSVQLLSALFFLFYFLKDKDNALTGVRSLIPLPRDESERLFRKAADALYATVYGTLVVAVATGITGGLVLWAVGVPAPAFWGAVITLTAILPYLGAFIVWVPAAVWLLATGHAGGATAVTAWGLAAAVLGEWAYAVLVGDRMRLHPVLVFLAFVGGLAVFGLTGIVLGPAVLAVALAMLDLWRRWLRGGESAEEVVKHAVPAPGELAPAGRG